MDVLNFFAGSLGFFNSGLGKFIWGLVGAFIAGSAILFLARPILEALRSGVSLFVLEKFRGVSKSLKAEDVKLISEVVYWIEKKLPDTAGPIKSSIAVKAITKTLPFINEREAKQLADLAVGEMNKALKRSKKASKDKFRQPLISKDKHGTNGQ